MQGERPAMRVAVIGLGVMGAGMARHLAEVGYTVTVYNRTRARAEELAPHGVAIAATPRDAAAASEAVILMLSDDHATRACTDGPNGVLAGLAPGTLVLQMATLAPEITAYVKCSATQFCAEQGGNVQRCCAYSSCYPTGHVLKDNGGNSQCWWNRVVVAAGCHYPITLL